MMKGIRIFRWQKADTLSSLVRIPKKKSSRNYGIKTYKKSLIKFIANICLCLANLINK